jgi:cation diffusion facilitator family transporter
VNPSAEALREREKRWAATSSVVAAVGLSAFKIVVGIATGSLGILAEAAHSGLDLVAALMTLFAVRISGRPADTEHLYGHGKVENLSALFETLLLLVTCVWIIWSAIHRLAAHRLEIALFAPNRCLMAVYHLADLAGLFAKQAH